MSLATRCTSCNTVFRVVQDQLKVSEGWVRCGRCHEVFNALESLFDLEPSASADSGSAPTAGDAVPAQVQAVELPEASHQDADVPTPVAAASPPAALESSLPVSAPANDSASPAAAVPDAEPIVEHETPTRASPPASAHVMAPLSAWPPPAIAATTRSGLSTADDTPASRLDARDRTDFEDARFNSALFDDDRVESSAELSHDIPMQPTENITAFEAGEAREAAATPDFLRRAEQSARWNRPAIVVVMALLCGVLLLGLAAQAAYHFRDFAAATYPQARPTLLALCEATGCRIEPVRRIDDIVIESSALTGAPAGNAIRLAVVLRNRGALPLAMPAIELSLTDAAGQMLARRALLPADFGKVGATLPGAAETPLQLVLAVDGRRPSGYTVEPFYP